MSSDNALNIQQNANEGTPMHLLAISPEVQRIIKVMQDTIDKQTKRIDELERKCNRTDFIVTTNGNRMNKLEERTLMLERYSKFKRYSRHAKLAWYSPMSKLNRVRCQNEVSNWLNSKKLCLNITKTVQKTIANSASGNSFTAKNLSISSNLVCKYLGIRLNSKLSFVLHVDYAKKRLGKQCGTISKLRHYFPRRQLIQYYKSKINRNIHYGFLDHGCISYSSLPKICLLQKKILKFNLFSQTSESQRR